MSGKPREASSLPLTPPVGRPLNVAVVVENDATLIDFAGPMEVFATAGGDAGPYFRVFTVSETLHPVRVSRSLMVVPEYALHSSPTPDIILFGALGFGPNPDVVSWSRDSFAKGAVLLSVCTGAFVLAETGLLDGRPATTHHDFFDMFAKRFPKVRLQKDWRYVEVRPRVFTAGGMTSGVDLALHIVERYFGRKEARAVAEYMEYQGPGWLSAVSNPSARK